MRTHPPVPSLKHHTTVAARATAVLTMSNDKLKADFAAVNAGTLTITDMEESREKFANEIAAYAKEIAG